jgi:hypothetical protein
MAGVVIAREFTGKMNLDSHAARVGPRDYIDALNITRKGQGAEDVNSNVVGNVAVAHTLPAGTNKCIGAKEDRLRNRVIYCIYNSNGNHEILSYSKSLNTVATLIRSKTDTGGVDILGFSLTSRIRSIDVIHRDEGDLIFINDGLNKPIAFNIDTIRDYAPDITDELIRLSKKMPLAPPTVSYDSDTLVKVNNHRKKLYQFCYRYVYKDSYKSAFSPYSKVALPQEGYNIQTDTDPTANNVVLVQVDAPTGDDFQKIEIGFRQCLGTTFSDFYLIDSIDRDDASINPSDTYTYRFYNDGAYPPIPIEETEQLFDVIPDKANAMTIVNGNVIVFGGITEGYNRLTRAQSNVQVSYRSVDTSPNASSSEIPSISYSITSSPSSSPTDYTMYIQVGAQVSGGSFYHVGFITTPVSGSQTTLSVDYTADNTDTRTTVRNELLALIDAALGPNFSVQATNGTSDDGFSIRITTHVSPSVGAQFYNSINIYATPPLTSQGSEACWKWNSQYTLGLVYMDSYGKVIGIMSFRPKDGDPNAYSVTTPNFNVNPSNSFAPRVPLLTGTISHVPPTGAVSFKWLRTKNQSASKFLQYITCKVETDDNYIYFCIANLDKYRENNTGFVPTYVFAQGDRIRVMNTVDNDSDGAEYTASYYQDDYEIVGEVDREITAAVGETPAVTGRWIKVKKPTTTTTYLPFMLVELYTPALSTSESLQVFYEFGESYPIYIHANGNRYHSGNVANQDATQAAHFDFPDGDTYFKFRRMYNDTLVDGDAASGVMELGVMDANYSDNWNSAVNSDGRPYVLEPDAKRQYNPVLVRFSEAYQTNTNINGLNKFYDLNYDEYIRDYGDIQKLISWNNYMIVFQKLKVGKVPIFQSILKKINGNDVVATDQLLNKIDYYLGEYGVGDSWESVAWSNSAIYWWDNFRGVNCRLSQSGIDPLSEVYQAYDFGLTNAVAGRSIFGAFDTKENTYISAFAGITGLAAKTLVYNEDRFADNKGYTSFVSYLPEAICCLNNLVISWSNGTLYTHNSSTYNNFYGVQYDSYIQAQFNDNAGLKKTLNAISYQGTNGWYVSEILTNTYHHGTTKQSTYINASEFREEEGYAHAAIGRDTNSAGGKANGDYMKGEWATVKINYANASSFVYLLTVLMRVTSSPKQP